MLRLSTRVFPGILISDMKIEFFTDRDICHNVRFPGELHASNEAILGLFYDYPSEYEAKFLFDDIGRVLRGEIDRAEFGDSVDGEMDAEFTVLSASNVKSKIYKLRTAYLNRLLRNGLSSGSVKNQIFLKPLPLMLKLSASAW